MRLVILESPLKAPTPEQTQEHVNYARRALRDALLRGEAPLASHITYPGSLSDDISEERALGIEAGLAWGRWAEATVCYIDWGISSGMQYGIDRAKAEGRPVEYRRLNSAEKEGAAPWTAPTT